MGRVFYQYLKMNSRHTWTLYFRVEKPPEFGATIAGLFVDSGVKNVKTWQLGGLATPAFSSYPVGGRLVSSPER